MRALFAGATGFVGTGVARAALARATRSARPQGAGQDLEQAGAELWEGDVLDADSLKGAGDRVSVAYYLVHSMGRGSDGDFAERERTAARNFARIARAEGVERVVYLGGLGGDQATSRAVSVLARRDPDRTRWCHASRTFR